jgi:hypothetical protein
MTDEDAVRAVVLQHVDSGFDGDPVRMERTLHPEYSALEALTARDLIEATATGQGRGEDTDDREIFIDISYLQADTASVTSVSHGYLEMLELVRTPDGWKILNGVWQSQADRASLAVPLPPEPSDEHGAGTGRRPALFPTPCEGRMRRRAPGPGGRRGGRHQ